MKLKLNCGISSAQQSPYPIETELEKARMAADLGVDFLSCISIYKPLIKELWAGLSKLDIKGVALCGVPFYESEIFGEPLLDVIKRYVEEYGVTILTMHMTEADTVERAMTSGFVINSRGGRFLMERICSGRKSNPNVDEFDAVSEYCQRNGVSIHVGTCLRPGRVEFCPEINAFTLEDLKTARATYDRLSQMGIYAEIECMGHVHPIQLDSYKYYLGDRRVCSMGPLITDTLNGFDDVNAMAGYHLAMDKKINISTICVITRSEHIKIPTLEDDMDAIRRWQAYSYLYGLSHETGFSAKAREKELQCISKMSRQRSQCSAHINVFGEMDIPEHCNICGDRCPLEMKKMSI